MTCMWGFFVFFSQSECPVAITQCHASMFLSYQQHFECITKLYRFRTNTLIRIIKLLLHSDHVDDMIGMNMSLLW